MKLSSVIEAVSARELLRDFNENQRPSQPGELLRFTGVDGYDVYNPSIPFAIDGKTVIAGRVESRTNEVSQTKFFNLRGGAWELLPDAPVLDLQDPFVTFIQGELWIGGVYVEWDGERLVKYLTHFYHGKTLSDLRFGFEGPLFMKDIRLLELADGRIALLSRPQGERMMKEYGCIAKIGFAIADSVDQIDAAFIENAGFLEGQFLPDEWGGSNQLYLLKNGLIGVIGHKSWGEYVDRVHVIHYYSMAFALDPDTRAVSQTKLIATRSCFPAGPQKNSRSADVVFTSGILRQGDGKAVLYAGLSDCEAGRLLIPDPLDEYESLDR